MGIPVNGKQGAFTWSGGSMTLSDGDGFQWSGVFNQDTRVVTPFGYDGEVHTAYLDDARGTLEYYLSQSGDTVGKPPIPSGTTGTLSLTTYAGQSRTFTALLSALATGANQSSNDPQKARYQWSFSAATPLEVLT